MTQADWIDSAMARANGFLRPGSIPIFRSIEGNGHQIGMEDYPFQGLDVETEDYEYIWLLLAKSDAAVALDEGTLPAAPAGFWKNRGRTPLGTPVATLAREGHDMLSSPCGYCGRALSMCSGDCERGT